MQRRLSFRLAFVLAIVYVSGVGLADDSSPESSDKISFAKQIRPLLAEKCFGCHQPAQSRGEYVMTDFERMMSGGETGDQAIVPGDPDNSPFVDLITPDEGYAEMPPEAEPFSDQDVTLIRQWITEGAINDFHREVATYDAEHPPTYSRLPNISSLDFSPDGSLLATTGFHEVLLLEFNPDQAESSEPAKIAKRLVGLSSRVEAVQFSPDGKKIAASGGNPGEMGEVQIWDVDQGKLLLSKVVSGDTVYGVSWSPDGSKVAFGCTDTTLRVIDAESGEQVLFQGAHEDWVRDTVFSVDGSQLVSVGRDMSCKLIDVGTQRFIDNITSITPGVLKGGIASVARHPERDEVLIGGADGIPKIYRMNRLTKRVIGDDANLVRQFPKMAGRIQSVTVSADGMRLAAGSSLDGSGTIAVYSYEFDSALPDDIKAIVAKQPRQHNAEEKKKLKDYITKDVKLISSTEIPEAGIYAVAFHPDRKHLVASGRDGLIRLVETETGKITNTIRPVTLESRQSNQTQIADWHFEAEPTTQGRSSKVNATVDAIDLIVSPAEIKFDLPVDYVQLVVQAKLSDGTLADVTPHIELGYDNQVVTAVDQLIQAVGNGKTEVEVRWNGLTATVPVTVDLTKNFEPDFRRDVNPVLSKLGCNAGTCHGSQGGKKGFKLSLRGYDPIYDVRSFTDDMASRRTNLASPSASLMLLKPTAQVAHEGGMVIEPDSRYYHLVHDWIGNGANLNLESPKVVSLEVIPKNPILPDAGSFQQVRIVATYSDGAKRDVTREAVVEAGDVEIVATDGAIVTALRRGESAILARFEGAFAATTLTVMGKRNGFVWEQPETWGKVDQLVAQKWKRMKVQPSGLCDDDEFIRRVYLDLTGLPPSTEELESFLADGRPAQQKRDELIDRLVGSPAYVEHFSNKWADLLQVNSKYLGSEGATAFRNWIREQVANNRPYNEFVFDILTATGSNRENPPASYYKIHRTPEETMENTTHLFLATRFNCNKCHDHPFERWTQDQYYETAAFFAQIQRKRDPESKDRKIGGTAVEGAKPLYEIISDLNQGEVTHERTGLTVAPKFPFESEFSADENASRRTKLAAWMTSQDNPYFASSYVNRLWGYMTGTGLIEPLDDIRAGNPPTNPELLNYLRNEFIQSGFDTRHVVKLICKSRTYQLSVSTNQFNADDHLNYSHAKARRLPAEVLFDSIHFVTGAELKIPGVKPGTRAAALPDSGVRLPSGFLATLGRPARESACECERANDLQLGSVLALVSGPDVSRAINDPANDLSKLVTEKMDDRDLVDELYLKILNRHASDAEIDGALKAFSEIDMDHQKLVKRREAARASFEQRLPDLEKQRLEAIKAATAEYQAAIAKHSPDLIEQEKKQAEALAAAEQALVDYQAQALGFNEWKQDQTRNILWHPLNIAEFQSEAGRQASILSDRSVLVENGKTGKDVYTVVAGTDLTGVATVRLEVLTDPSLPNNGPGLASANGNLVITEFAMEVAHPDSPNDWQPVAFQSAIANIEQPNFPIANTIDGKSKNNSGWALANAVGKESWGTYQLKLPVGFSGGTLVRFKLFQQYDDAHQIGRFRISVSKHHQPVGLSLSESLIAKLTIPEKDLPDEIKQQLKSAFERSDPKLAKLKKLVAENKSPVAVPPEVRKTRLKFARVSQPVPRDAELVQLERDVEVSEKQLANKRLTAAQDLTWALINSPSFLFNR